MQAVVRFCNPNLKEEAIEKTEEELIDILEYLRSNTASNRGLIIEKPEMKRKQETEFANIPLPKAKKSKFSGRVGIKNEKRKASSNVTIIDDVVKASEKSKEITEVKEEGKKEKEGKEHKEEDSDNEMVEVEPTNNSFFRTRIIGKLPNDPNLLRKNLLSIGCHNVTLIDMLSLEINHLKHELKIIRKVDKNYKTGWLHDEIMNSFSSI